MDQASTKAAKAAAAKLKRATAAVDRSNVLCRTLLEEAKQGGSYSLYKMACDELWRAEEKLKQLRNE
jgi:hypothetical protein